MRTTGGWWAASAPFSTPATAARRGFRRRHERNHRRATQSASRRKTVTPETTTEKPLYWLGRKLIERRIPVMIIVVIVTSFFAYHTYRLFEVGFVTSFGDLLPQSHEFMKIHNKYAGTFGGANNVMVMFEVKEGNLFNQNDLGRIYRMTEELDRVYGVNHSQIDSIGHRTTRSLRVAAGGTMRSEPVMIGPPKTDEQAADI